MLKNHLRAAQRGTLPPTDWYPVKVEGVTETAEGVPLMKVRALITGDIARFYSIENRQVILKLKLPFTEKEKLANGVKLFTDGAEYLVTQAGGCGCGDKLKNYPRHKLPQ